MARSTVLSLVAVATMLWSGPRAAASPDTDLAAFVTSLRPDAEAHDISPALFDQVFAGLTPDPTVAAMTARQPENVKSLGAYLTAQVTPARVAQGRALLRQWDKVLAAIETRTGVPRAIVVAVWGHETNYGTASGGKDVIRSMATLASIGVRLDLYRAELVAALTMLQSGEVTRDQLRGSWAGAMGQPQFMPSSFLHDAVDGDGDGRRDIWTDVPDALASIAHFLQRKGWQADRPWGVEVTVPPGADMSVSRATFAQWAARGLVPVTTGRLPPTAEGILLYPAGIAGPAFLVTANYEVIKTYNFSDAYVLAVADLADEIEGRAPFAGPWPRDPPMSREARIALQARLADLGYAVDNREGRISLALRDTIRLAQHGVGLRPDGNPSAALLDLLATARPVGGKPQ